METPETDIPIVESSPKVDSYNLGWLWPAITSEEEAKKAARSGVYAAGYVAIITGLIAIIAIVLREKVLGMDGWAMVDALLFAFLAWRIFKHSLGWAIAGTMIYFGEICWRWSTTGVPKPMSVLTTGLIVLAFISGVRGVAFLNKR
jgi:hypothetical protein